VTGAVRAGGDGASDGDLVTLDTPRLILRQWQATDLDRYVEMFADPEVARYIFRGRPARREQVSEMSGSYLRQWRDLRLGPFAAIDKATGAWIGQIGLNHLAYWPGPEKVEVGWELHRRWGGAFQRLLTLRRSIRQPLRAVRGPRRALAHLQVRDTGIRQRHDVHRHLAEGPEEAAQRERRRQHHLELPAQADVLVRGHAL
jgi:Spy/CpxP family protein refolding chaperone